jgi:hypothetical protein
MLRRYLLVLVAFSTLSTFAGDGSGKRWWSYVEYLASDKLEGRQTGSEGHRLAAQFVAVHFKQDDLTPAGTQGYFQPVKFYSCAIVEKESSLALVRGGNTEPLRLGEDAIIRAAVPPAPSLHAALTFVGFGLSVPELKYDDFAGQDVRGKIAVYITGGPSSIPNALRAHAQSAGERWRALHRAGAIGVISIYNPHHMDIPWSRAMVLRFLPTLRLADPALDELPGDQLGIGFNPAEAEKLFRGSGHTFAELIEIAQRGDQLPRFPLAVSIEERAKFTQQEVTSQNIMGILPGSDPALRKEYVVISAHVDHLGVGEPINGDRIYNGAMDNAAGVATVLDVADALHASGAKTRRSLLFLVVTGEEAGLLGSRYFTVHPTVPLPQVIGDLNIDMFLPIFPLRRLTVRGLEESDLGSLLKNVAAAEGVEVQPDPAPERNSFIRSDQYSFIKKGIPSIFFSFGYAKGSPEEAAFQQWITNRYHAPSDDIQQPVDLPAAAQYNKIVLRLAEAMADGDKRPQWNPDSFFRRYAK